VGVVLTIVIVVVVAAIVVLGLAVLDVPALVPVGEFPGGPPVRRPLQSRARRAVRLMRMR